MIPTLETLTGVITPMEESSHGISATIIKLTSDYSTQDALLNPGVNADGTQLMKMFPDSGEFHISQIDRYATPLKHLNTLKQLTWSPLWLSNGPI